MKHITQMPEFLVGEGRERVVTCQNFDPAQTASAFAYTSGFNPCADFAASVEKGLAKRALRHFGQGCKTHTRHGAGLPRCASVGYACGQLLAAAQNDPI